MSVSEECQELAQRLVEGTADEEDASRLSKLLRKEPEARAEYLSFMAIHSALAWEFRAEAPEGMEPSVDLEAIQPQARSQGTSHFARSRRLSWFLAIATAVLAIFLVGRLQSKAFASRLIEAAISAHAQSLQREYQLEIDWENLEAAKSIRSKDVRVSTQGDRFWISVEMQTRLAIGNGPDGSVWIALGPNRGVVIEEDELGPVLRDVRGLYGLRFESMLTSVLQNHRLRLQEQTDSTYVINATPRRARGWIREVSIEMDRETNVVQRLTAKRRSLLRGPSTATFTLIATGPVDESKYDIQGHLASSSFVYTRSNSPPNKRRQLLETTLGPATRGWIENVQTPLQ